MKYKLLLFTTFALTHVYCISQVRVSVIGASVAAGYGIPGPASYPSQMSVILGSNWNIGNFGVSGATMLKEADDPYINSSNYTGAQNFSPNIVTIELGSNDAKDYNWVHKDSFVTDYTRFINVFKALPSHPVIYICLPIPAFTHNFSINDSIITNGVIPLVKTIAADNNVKLIDLNTPLQGHPDWYQSDGIHPNETGALVLAQVIARAIAAPTNLLLSVPTIHQIDLSWTDNTNETGFTIERSVDSITWNTLISLPANTTTYSDMGITASTKYYYRVYATISVGNTVNSDIASTSTTVVNTLIPIINSTDTASGTMGQSFNYAITASNNPTSYTATNLPDGLTINTSTGIISGTIAISPNSGSNSIVTITATNTNGTGTKILTLSVKAIASPFNGTAATIPGKIEAENYDYGGEGIAYHDTEPSNTLGQYRTAEGVDIENCTDVGGGYSIGQIQANEWTQYTVNVITAGTYTLQLRVASINSGETFHLEMDGINISGTLAVPNTGGWQTWQTVSASINLPTTGLKKLRIIMGTGGFNINSVNFIYTGPILPLNLTSFNAIYKDCNTIAFNWQVADESPGTYYQLESSTIKNNFAIIATILPKGASAYQYIYHATAGMSYFFRLKIINKEGEIIYSPVIAMHNSNCSANNITVVNLSNNYLQVNNLDGNTNHIILYSVDGLELSNTIINSTSATISIDRFSRGIYWLKIISKDNNILKTAKVVL
ncbi:carbohydrate-binding protein [Ferruginibacter albus]|uniref:carbohydrate-binding protein n=1 Tax=Ferruginibacter albus TaxID=2875540 RepID=UPI001CC82DF4|nr:carbohydrate-binding protein [Ferruginibacter albus]UAY51237.1 carbohydrate-binding protein [Ferruginibacter albus]